MRLLIYLLLPIYFLSGCSHFNKLDAEATLATGVLVYAGASELSGGRIDNYGTTHAVISYGVSEAVAKFGDSLFPHPEQEWLADTVAIVGGIIPAAYYYDREQGQTTDSKADYLFPVGNLIRVIAKRLSGEQ